MLLILEIALTIWAWKRGWKKWALLPVGIGIGSGFLLGLAFGGTEIPLGSLDAFGLIVDIACIGALIGMITRPRKACTPAVPRTPPSESEQALKNLEANPW
jgi:hypothetical protein